MSNWRITRERAAPSAARIEISLRRNMARARSRLETFAQAISISAPTAAISTNKGVRRFPAWRSASGMISNENPVMDG